MLDLLPFSIERASIAGACLWAFALYLGFASLREWVTEMLDRWFNFAERWMYTSAKEFERTRAARESQNAFYASVTSIVPFLIAGVLCNIGVEYGLGRSWAVSVGILACFACGIYDLGRRSTAADD
ncbi:hypothetical protein KR51_00021570 [Rubidibacter lacunae KORDI 51-2]|uniref:Uncharacterized protein n=1 Tax=Rubidibacter lacunae KORDI 51-2 TaxID=582515 RepID=U5DK32_9CHRO|nr:hypothetical protein [Rubidibacter lacunae]ERN41267.1 hypothetical protein KR51_00021570 [Rubidibacter lacunae KORDI 51-2]